MSQYALLGMSRGIFAIRSFVREFGSGVDGVLVRCSKRLGRPGLPTALSFVNQAELSFSSVRARAVAMEVTSSSEITDVRTDTAGAEGSRAEDLEPTSAVVLAVNFHSGHFEIGDMPDFVKRLLTEGGRTEFLRPYVPIRVGKAPPRGASLAQVEGRRLYFLVMSLPEVPNCLQGRLLEETNRIYVSRSGQIGFMCRTPHPFPPVRALSTESFELASPGLTLTAAEEYKEISII